MMQKSRLQWSRRVELSCPPFRGEVKALGQHLPPRDSRLPQRRQRKANLLPPSGCRSFFGLVLGIKVHFERHIVISGDATYALTLVVKLAERRKIVLATDLSAYRVYKIEKFLAVGL